MIVETDLSVLYEEMNTNDIANVVVEAFAMTKREEILKHLYSMNAFKNFQKFPMEYPYFNAGFLLINIDLAKKEKLFEKALNFISCNPNPPYADQDTLNAVIGQCYKGRIKYLPPEYNVFCDFGINNVYWNDCFYEKDDIIRAINSPKIYHYAGGHKPWLDDEQNYHDIWKYYYNISTCKKNITMYSKRYTIKSIYYIFDKLPLIYIFEKKDATNTNKKIFIFKKIPLLKIRITAEKSCIKLFFVLPIFTCKRG